jgi:hypothetical protein
MKADILITHLSRIKHILETFEKARDCDATLVYYYCRVFWKDPSSATLREFLEGVRDGKLPTWETCTRLRRKVQEENPALRGSEYVQRMAMQTEVKKDMGYATT